MSTKTDTYKIAACTQADHTNSALALSWTYQKGNPNWSESFASLLDKRLKQMLPERCLRGILQGRESEIHQKAALMLLERYLRGNQKLLKATESRSLEEVTNQLQRSLNASLRLATYKLRRFILRELNRFAEFDESVQQDQCQCIHYATRTHVSELPFEAQRSLLLHLLKKGFRENLISPANTRIVHRMLDEGLTQSELAKELGISRQAINQRISSVSEVVRVSVEKVEFPTQ